MKTEFLFISYIVDKLSLAIYFAMHCAQHSDPQISMV